MYNIEQWKEHLNAFYFGRGKKETSCESWVTSHNQEFNKDIYDTLFELYNFSKESINFLFSKINLARDNKLTDKDIDDLINTEFKNDYILKKQTMIYLKFYLYIL